MRECPACALPVADEKASVCPYCGYEFPTAAPGQRVVAWLMILLLLSSGLYALLAWLLR
ncbi:zinc ribbon domain-containing protein [Rhodothermus profundi]|uniref:Zinc-ribbon domain-containing protein n=1 Tax=Rhodothermus profundi TaxID=633813 RepID=A0A1M6R6P9_9BACT|nr:zinc ribbon domain-containing protein [Rhodothermus profundi]SHK28151.1 zinc-ribbon domain-containing protein [Rhodothermus profundi]